jgi:hypothetical protein
LTEKELKAQGVTEWMFWDGEKKKYNSYNAISRAHKKIVRHAQHHKLDQVLIMEDDVRFTDVGALDYFLENKPDDFDIYLAGIYFGDILPDKTVKKFQGLHCYIVHNRFYSKFLGIPETGDIDVLLGGKGKYVVCYPFAAIQYNGFSDHHQNNMNYDGHLVSREMWKRPAN